MAASPRRTAVRAALVFVLVLVVAGAAVVAVRAWHSSKTDDASSLTFAMSHALPTGEQFSWTDWAGVRAKLGDDLDTGSSTTAVRAFLTKAFDADLSSRSALGTSAEAMQEHYGFSPATLSWELFSQSPTAAVVMMGLPADADLSTIETDLRTIGYQPPDTVDGMYRGNLDDIKRIGEVTPELTFISVDPVHRVLLASDSDTGLAEGMAAYRADNSAPVGGLADVVGAVQPSGQAVPLSAALTTGDRECNAQAMARADAADEAAGEQLIQQAGEVTPLTGFAMADEPDGDTLVAMSFSGPDEARTNATTRARLAAGPAPGQGGDFTDRYALGPVTALGNVVTMVLHPKPGAYLLSDLSNGPLLFATC